MPRLIVFALLSAALVAQAEGARVYVVRPHVVNLPETAIPAIEAAVAAASSSEGVTTFTEGDAREALQRSSQLQALGSESDELSLAGLGQAVGAAQLLSVTVTRLGEETRVFSRLIDTAKGAVIGRREVKASEHGGDLLEAIKAATRLTLAPLFAGLKGLLDLRVSEEGANVLLDGDQLGTSPLAPIEITGGSHLLAIVKAGFVRHQETVRVGAGESLVRDVKLVPSPEFLRDWRATHGRNRSLAWVSSGATLLLAGAAVATGVLVNARNADMDAERARYDALDEREKALQFDASTATLAELSNAAGQYATLSLGFTAGGVLGGLLAGYFWIWGEDPDRYAAYEK